MALTPEQRLGKHITPKADGCWIYTGPKKMKNMMFEGQHAIDAMFLAYCILNGNDARNYTNHREWRIVRSCGRNNCVAPKHTDLVKHDPSCRHCGDPMIGYFPYRVFCSERCAYTHRSDEALELAQAAAEQLNLGAAAGWLRKLYQYLADRDGPNCALCSKRVDLALSGTKDNGKPSVDHIVPRSKGGPNDLANLTLTHLSCNVAKGNRVANEQLRLYG